MLVAVEITMTHVWWTLGLALAVLGSVAAVVGLVYLGALLAIQSICMEFWKRR